MTHPAEHASNGKESNGAAQDSCAQNSVYSDHPQLPDVAQLFPEINTTELSKLLIQTLADLGYHKSAKMLKSESGLELDSPTINRFVQLIKNGQFDDAEATIDQLHFVKDSDALKTQIKFYIKREKFLECLYETGDDTKQALHILRNEINELTSIQEIRSLTSLLMNKNSLELQVSNGWVSSKQQSREFLLNKISDFINPNEMIPKFRLFKLIQQAISYQKSVNLYDFGSIAKPPSLFEDVRSDKTLFPNKVVKQLTDQKNEVWYIRFSNDGSKLVTTCIDHTLLVYDVQDNFKLIHNLRGHDKQVLYASFSPNDEKLISCSINSDAILWDLTTGELEFRITIKPDVRIWCAEWYPDGSHYVVSSPDKEIAIFKTGTNEQVSNWSTGIIQDFKITRDYKLLLVTYDNEVEVFDLVTKSQVKKLHIGTKISSISASTTNSSEFLISICYSDELQLWDWQKGVLLSKYLGHKQGKYILRSSFGFDDKIIATGSIDGYVFLWNKQFGALLGAFPGHKGMVNCLAWNPKIKSMFATGGDDSLVKIWGPS